VGKIDTDSEVVQLASWEGIVDAEVLDPGE